MTTPICTIDANGITVPLFADCLSYFQDQYKGIYGSDVYLGNDSQDGQFLGLLATALSDNNAQCFAAYNSFSPATAQGIGLSSVVKINGLSRKVPSNSTWDILIVGQAGSVITNGAVTDGNGNTWTLPASVTIPLQGQLIVTATSSLLGSFSGSAGTLLTIATPTRGWQSATANSNAVAGKPVESDPVLRIRQSISTGIDAKTRLDAIIAVVADIPDVIAYRPYENDSNITDANGLPPHSVSIVVDGGDAQAIASAIFFKKTEGSQTYGTTTEIIIDPYGIPHVVGFFRPTTVPINYGLTIKALQGFTSTIQTQIVQSLVDWTNALGIGNSVLRTRAYVPTNLNGGAGSQTFEIVSLTASRNSAMLVAADVPIAFNELPNGSTSAVTVTVTT